MKVIAFLIVLLAASCYALPGGAPLSTCVNLTPMHGMIAQPDPSPYEIDISAFSCLNEGMTSLYYMPGEYYNSKFEISRSESKFRSLSRYINYLYILILWLHLWPNIWHS